MEGARETRKAPFASLTALGMRSKASVRRPPTGRPPGARPPIDLGACAPLRQAGVIAERYVLGARIAKGGMGRLWQAFDRRLGRDVVLKLLRLDVEGGDLRSRFEAEARIAASLRSRHIVELHDVGVDDGVPFMVFERLAGEDVADRLERCARLSPTRCAWIARQTARGLAVAHRAGVVHRDIKPSNLFIATNVDADAEVLKIIDFGIAKWAASSSGVQTRPGFLVGSPSTMSPEQVSGLRTVDARSDLFSLACVLYRCLVGRSAFRAEDVPSTLRLVARGEYDAPSVIDRDLRASDAFFERALAVDPDARFQTSVELADAFDLIVRDLCPAPARRHPDHALPAQGVHPRLPPR
jgi:serine/threonine protein kinase